jgi:hypothetical protein
MNYKGKGFFTIRSARFSINIGYSTSMFLKGFFEAKKLDMEELEICALFCTCYLSTFSLL